MANKDITSKDQKNLTDAMNTLMVLTTKHEGVSSIEFLRDAVDYLNSRTETENENKSIAELLIESIEEGEVGIGDCVNVDVSQNVNEFFIKMNKQKD